MTVRTVARNRTLVQYALDWPASELGWTTIEGAWSEKSSEGFCNDLGSATVVYPFGSIKRQGSPSVVLSTYLGLCGAYIRIAEEDATGTIVAADGTKFTAFWVGTAGESDIAPNNAGTGYDERVQCQGILSILDQIVPPVHYGVPSGGPLNPAADIGSKVTFNMLGNRKTGNRSADKYDFGGGYSAYVFDMSGDGEEWTARDILEYALAIAYLAAPGGPTFTIGGQASAITFKDKFSLSGASCLEMITRTLNPRQGVGFRAAYNGTTSVLIDVMSLSKDAITVAGGDSLPANDRQRTIDLTPANLNSGWSIKESQLATYDNIDVVFGAPQYAITFSLADFEPDWTPAEKAAFDALDEEDPERNVGAMARVYRRFKIKSDWVGTATSGFAMPTDRSVETSALHGEGGYTGEQVSGGQLVETKALRLMRRLPMPEGYDWSSPPTDFDKAREGMKPIVIVRSGAKYQTLADYCSVENISVQIDEENCAFTLGPDKIVENIADLLTLGDELFITLGIESQMESIVSWCRPTADMVRDKRRIMTKKREKLRRRFITAGTFLGVEGETLKQAPGSLTTIEDDLPLAKSLLAALVPWYSVSEWVVSRTLSGTIDLAEDFVTGDLITQASFQFVDGSTKTIPAIGVITSIVRDYTNDGKVSLFTKRIEVDTEAFA